MKMLVTLLLLGVVSQHASGVEVHEGVESVLLPCQVPADVSRNSTAVWDRDEFKVPTIHVRDPDGDDLVDQNDRYKHRTSMRADALQTGDLSLTLRNPTVSDSGTYTCTTRRFGRGLSRTEVQLKVTEPPPPPPPVWPKVLLGILAALLLLAAAFGLFVCLAYKRMKSSEVSQPELVEVTQGQESVLLPFKLTADLPQAVSVEWRLSEPKHMKVHVYERGNNQPDQHQDYRGRTEMKKDPLRTKDLSLRLKDLQLTDSGLYTCTVCNKDGNRLLQKSVTLSVRVSQPEFVEVSQDQESVLLPFKLTADLPEDVSVEWRLSEPKHMKVHVYERGNNQPDQHQDYRGRTEMDEDPLRDKDLSLTLKHLQLNDSGVYTCTVCNKDGDELLQKSVILSVFDPEPEFVEVIQDQEFVLLPFKLTAELPQDVSVQWRHKHMKVHVYERGNNQPDQHQDYRGRTEMDEDPLRNKDLSLTLKDLQLTDSGVYTCTVYNKDGDELLQKSVFLSVRDYQPEFVEVTQGQEFVLLPFKLTADLPEDVSVEWRLSEPKHMKVHVYERGNNQPDQHQDYRGRTEMDEDPLRTKDLSLTLKHLQPTDSGLYTCTVYNKDGDELLQKSVILSVRVSQAEFVEVSQGQESVLLPFKLTADLPQDVSVQWRLSEPKDMKVHVYERGNNQPDQQHQDYRGRTEMDEDPLRTKDLSLTLKHAYLPDRGLYTCTVCNKDGDELLQKSVFLCVRVPEPEKVVVTQRMRFVLLPFKTTADLPQDVSVEWRLSEPERMKVHVYERGNNQPDQHQDYRGRTEMDEDPLRTKDLSLTLKHLYLNDSGLYTCTVCNKDGKRLLQKSVRLSVFEYQVEMVEVTQDQESVLLPFKLTADLPQYVSVEWRLSEPKHMKVHVYERGNNQPDQHQDYRGRTEMDEDLLGTKDLSLTLKHLQLTDSGVYTCTVYSYMKRYILLQKSVTLRVRATLGGTMAEMLTDLKGLKCLRAAPRAQTKQEVRNHEDVPLIEVKAD